ncbi:MAG: phosphatase PAP2 family protein [Panacagrimonas sp.]
MNQVAIFVADHLPEFFSALLVLVLGSAAMLWSLLHRLRAARTAAGTFAGGRLLDRGAIFLLALAALSVFLAVAGAIGSDDGLGRFDQQLAIRMRQTLSPPSLQTFAWVTRLGNAEVQWFVGVGVAAFLLLRSHPWLAVSWVAAVGGNGLLNRSLKVLFQRERPLHDHGWVSESGWSFPSGHASGAVAMYGMLAYLLIRMTPRTWHLPILLSAITLILFVGFSRVALHVHYFSDVIAGFASATAWLIVCIGSAEMIRARRARPKA